MTPTGISRCVSYHKELNPEHMVIEIVPEKLERWD